MTFILRIMLFKVAEQTQGKGLGCTDFGVSITDAGVSFQRACRAKLHALSSDPLGLLSMNFCVGLTCFECKTCKGGP